VLFEAVPNNEPFLTGHMYEFVRLIGQTVGGR
jgi:hypothetical protein